MELPVLCEARQDGRPAALRCDLPKDHGGDRHEEEWVVTWLRDGSDVRWCTNGVDSSQTVPAYGVLSRGAS